MKIEAKEASNDLNFQENRLKFISSTFLIGGVSGMTAKTVIAPFDRAKIIFQTTNRPFGFLPMFKLLRDTVSNNGFFSLWRGHTLTLSRTFPYTGLQYLCFDFYKVLLKPENKELPIFRRFLAGSLAGATASIVVYPLELLRSRMAVQLVHKSKHISIYDNVILLKNNHGLNGLFFGLNATLIGIIPYGALAFGTFETLKVMNLKSHPEQNELTHLQRTTNGALAGLIAQTLTYPLDVVRRRMQTEGAHNMELITQRQYLSVSSTLRSIYKVEGFRGLFKGVSLNWVKGPLSLGISFSIFDFLKTRLNEKTTTTQTLS